MIGVWSEYSSTFLVVFAAIVVVAFALPFLFAPIAWGRLIGFKLPEQTDLAVYFGRSLGAAALGISLICYMASQNPGAQPLVFDGLILISAVLTITHIHGAVMKIQPLIETLEIPFWFGLMLLQIAVYPAGQGYGLLG